jgi:hypothetical protein
MTDEELIARLRVDDPVCEEHFTANAAADRIEGLAKEIALQGNLLADAYGAILDWDEVLKQRADHEAMQKIETAEAEIARLREERDAAVNALAHEVSRSRRHLAKSTLDTLAAIAGDSHD